MRTYNREFRLSAVERLRAGEKISELAKELGVHRKVLYEWKRRVNEGGESSLRERGGPHRSDGNGSRTQRIAELERTVAQQRRIIEFFRPALLRFETLRQ